MINGPGCRVGSWILLRGAAETAQDISEVITSPGMQVVGTRAGDFGCSTKQRGLPGDCSQSEKSTVAQAPDTHPLEIDVRQRLQIIGGHPGVICIVDTDAVVHAR